MSIFISSGIMLECSCLCLVLLWSRRILTRYWYFMKFLISRKLEKMFILVLKCLLEPCTQVVIYSSWFTIYWFPLSMTRINTASTTLPSHNHSGRESPFPRSNLRYVWSTAIYFLKKNDKQMLLLQSLRNLNTHSSMSHNMNNGAI